MNSKLLQRFYHLEAHRRRHPSRVDPWNPYYEREAIHLIEQSHFDSFYNPEGDCGSVDFAFMGCLDAPEQIPLGYTRNINTLGGWVREEYPRISRECHDWQQWEAAAQATAEMLREILNNLDN